MAHFYGELRGLGRSRSTRCGSVHLWGHLRGWTLGVEIVCSVEAGRDVIHIYRTGGSHAASTKQLLAVVRDGEERKEHTTSRKVPKSTIAAKAERRT